MAATVWPKASCQLAPKCVQPRPCSQAMAMSWPTSSATAWCNVAKALKSGVGVLRTVAKPMRKAPNHEQLQKIDCFRLCFDLCRGPNSLWRQSARIVWTTQGRCRTLHRYWRQGVYRVRLESWRQKQLGPATQNARPIWAK